MKNIIIYSKSNGEAPVPLTVRIEWLADGTIEPRMYWLPDGSLYEINNICEMTPLAFLKDGGAGIRFRVRASLAEAAQMGEGIDDTWHETYIYFTDDWFCGRNIIDERYGHEHKAFIPVTLDVFPEGDYELIGFSYKEAAYLVEKTLAIEPRASLYAGGAGLRHKVEAYLAGKGARGAGEQNLDAEERKIAALYFEINKWFVAKV